MYKTHYSFDPGSFLTYYSKILEMPIKLVLANALKLTTPKLDTICINNNLINNCDNYSSSQITYHDKCLILTKVWDDFIT